MREIVHVVLLLAAFAEEAVAVDVLGVQVNVVWVKLAMFVELT